MTPSRRNPSPPQNDPLLNSLLEEVLGGTTPPDLRDRIVRRTAPLKSDHARDEPRQPVASPVLAPPIQDWSRGSFGSPSRIAERRGRPHATRRWAKRILQMALLTAGAVLLFVVAQSELRRPADLPEESALARRMEVAPGAPPSRPPDSISRTPTDAAANRDESPASASADRSGSPLPASFASDEPRTVEFGSEISPGEEDFFEANASQPGVVQRIDEYLQRAWDLARVQPSPLISDPEWCQRAYAHLVGRSPSQAELARFLELDPALRRQQLVDRLLSDRRYREEYAQHWASQWSARLIGSALDDSPSTASYRAGLERYLRPALVRNTPCDQIAKKLLTATGSNSVNEQDYNPATNYLLALMDGRGIRPTQEVCRVMLGQRATCAQCHDDPHDNLAQEQFWQLTACFRQLQVQSLGAGRWRLSDRDFGGDRSDGKPVPGTVAYQQANGTWMHVTAALPDGGALEPSGRVDDAHYRRELADWLVSTEQFPRAIINRFWARFFQYGFTFPVDDMGRHNPVAHPELLDLLAEEFTRSGYDLNQLFCWIVLSDAFSRSDVLTETNAQDLPLAGAPPLFSRAYYRPSSFVDPTQAIAQLIEGRIDAARRGTAERLDDAIVARVSPSLPVDAAEAPAAPAEQPVARDGQQLTIGQLRLVRALAASRLSVEQRVEHLFQIALGRNPRADEARRASEIYEANATEPLQSLEGLLWALVNTNEFVRDH